MSLLGRIESGERRLDVVEFVAVAKALKVDPVELFTRFARARNVGFTEKTADACNPP